VHDVGCRDVLGPDDALDQQFADLVVDADFLTALDDEVAIRQHLGDQRRDVDADLLLPVDLALPLDLAFGFDADRAGRREATEDALQGPGFDAEEVGQACALAVAERGGGIVLHLGAILQVDADGQDVADLGGALVLEELPRAGAPQGVGMARLHFRRRHRQADRTIVAPLGRVIDLAHLRRLADLREAVEIAAGAKRDGEACDREQTERGEGADHDGNPFLNPVSVRGDHARRSIHLHLVRSDDRRLDGLLALQVHDLHDIADAAAFQRTAGGRDRHAGALGNHGDQRILRYGLRTADITDADRRTGEQRPARRLPDQVAELVDVTTAVAAGGHLDPLDIGTRDHLAGGDAVLQNRDRFHRLGAAADLHRLGPAGSGDCRIEAAAAPVVGEAFHLQGGGAVARHFQIVADAVEVDLHRLATIALLHQLGHALRHLSFGNDAAGGECRDTLLRHGG